MRDGQRGTVLEVKMNLPTLAMTSNLWNCCWVRFHQSEVKLLMVGSGMEADLNQRRSALARITFKLEEESQFHRIVCQRLNDEQETSRHLKQQLQDALS